MSENIRHYHNMTSSLSPIPTPRSTIQRNLVSRRTTALATNLALPQWKSGIWDIDISSRTPTLELLQEKFMLLDFGKRDYVGGAQGPVHKVWVESLYMMFENIFYHYLEHCEDLAETLEDFTEERDWPRVPRAELYRDLIDEIAEWRDLLEKRYVDGDFRAVLGFFDEENEIMEVKDLLKRVKNELKEDMAENYVSPTTMEIARLSLVAQIVKNTRDGGIWREDHHFLERMVSIHLGDDDEDPWWFESIFEVVVRKASRKVEEDQSSKDFRAKSSDFVRNVVREMETALERNPQARGQNIYGVLEERNEEARNRPWTGRSSNYGRGWGIENRQPIAQVQIQVEELQNYVEELTFM